MQLRKYWYVTDTARGNEKTYCNVTYSERLKAVLSSW